MCTLHQEALLIRSIQTNEALHAWMKTQLHALGSHAWIYLQLPTEAHLAAQLGFVPRMVFQVPSDQWVVECNKAHAWYKGLARTAWRRGEPVLMHTAKTPEELADKRLAQMYGLHDAIYLPVQGARHDGLLIAMTRFRNTQRLLLRWLDYRHVFENTALVIHTLTEANPDLLYRPNLAKTLTPRNLHVLRQMADGLNFEQIDALANNRPGAAQRMVYNLRDRLGIESANKLVILLTRLEIL